ncbi:MAG TPA: GNAT family N-acetyltransferase [Hyphomicrobium sp.]|nr:GNAT family N-acetyltransferase [Hyphomicrobium sp.]
MPIRTRALQPGDEKRWRELFNGYVAFYEADVPGDVIDVTWKRVLAGADGMYGAVAESDAGVIAGFAVCVFHRSSWSQTWYCYLEDLFVDPAARGHGVGRALIDAVYAEADARGASRTYWVTAGNNATARQLYDSVAELSPFVQYRRP